MLGFSIGIYRQPGITMNFDGPGVPSGEERLIWWDRDWLDLPKQLADAGHAKPLQTYGYPTVYVAEREPLTAVLTPYLLGRDRRHSNCFLRAVEPENGTWLQSLHHNPHPAGHTREVLYGTTSLPIKEGLISDSGLGWIESLARNGDADLIEDGEQKLYTGRTDILVPALVAHVLEPARNDEALLIVAWDLS